MSIVIKGMDMPTSCSRCPCSNDASRFCRVVEEYIPMLGKPAFCPLVDVPDTNVGDMISRQAAIDDIETVNPSMPLNVNWVKNWVKTLPSARPEITQKDVELYCRRRCLTLITNELFNEIKARWPAQQEPIKGKWLERFVDVDGKKSIEEWQSAKCSVCGRYHTTPYLYYFDDYNFCPNCGAKMEK